MNGLDPAHERHLLERAGHEPDAFREIYGEYFPRLYTYFSYQTERAEDAEDLTSETFLQAVKSLPRFQYRGEGSFGAWLFGIARNRLHRFYRRNGHSPAASPLEDLGDLEVGDPSPEAALLQKESAALIRRLIQRLPARRQEIVLLRFFGGLRNNEIAALLGLDEHTIAAHLYRGLKDLQGLFAVEALGRQEVKDD